jgi:glycosyltransferase involved in cell wall biosynthesis
MHRICRSLVRDGFQILFVGRQLKSSSPLANQPFDQKRISCIFNRGFLFYFEFNTRLFFFLLFKQANAICAIDLDTILPCYFVSILRNKKRVYDAHEYFSEQKEIITRPFIHFIWKKIENYAISRFPNGYTVNQFIQNEFNKKYGVEYCIIRNLPELAEHAQIGGMKNNLIIYQGAVNQGRCFETLIPAMTLVDAQLIICGKGNFFNQVEHLIKQNGLSHKIELKGYVAPEHLKLLTPQCSFGLTLFEPVGLNQYYSLSNRFFDYIMAGIPQVCVAYPEYKQINDEFEVALLIESTDSKTIAQAMNHLLHDTVLYNRLKQNCNQAKEVLNWNKEEIKLKSFWRNICTS